MTLARSRLMIFVAAALLLPAFAAHLIPARRDFDPQPIARLRQERPEIVLIGDSVLGGSVDPRLFSHKTGASDVELLWNGGAASAAWYLLLKNYVVASGIRPRLVCIFFRERMLTDPTFRTTPTYRHFLESIRHEKEPVYRALLQGDEAEEQTALGRVIDWLYPLNSRRYVQQEKISRLAFRIAAGGSARIGPLRRRVNETFDVAKLRDEIMDESTELSGAKAAEFNPNPQLTFLPHMVTTAKRGGIRLCFVRQKRYPLLDGTVPQSESLQRYIAQLRNWLESHDCTFIDLTNDSEPDQSMYNKPGDDHMRPAAKEKMTMIYAEKLRPLLHR
ncbi:MAG: hypothetical protein ABJB49_05800 [Nitrospirota bacterium]